LQLEHKQGVEGKIAQSLTLTSFELPDPKITDRTGPTFILAVDSVGPCRG